MFTMVHTHHILLQLLQHINSSQSEADILEVAVHGYDGFVLAYGDVVVVLAIGD